MSSNESKNILCGACNGLGYLQYSLEETCKGCHGHGYLTSGRECAWCEGSGRCYESHGTGVKNCTSCGGEGFVAIETNEKIIHDIHPYIKEESPLEEKKSETLKESLLSMDEWMRDSDRKYKKWLRDSDMEFKKWLRTK